MQTSGETATTSTASPPVWLFVLPWSLDHVGGVNQVVINLAAQMAKAGRYEPIVLFADWEAPVPVWDVVQGVKVVRWRIRTSEPGMSVKQKFVFGAWKWNFEKVFRQFCKEHGVAVINPHYPTLAAKTLEEAAAGAESKPKMIVSVHGADLTGIQASGTEAGALWRDFLKRADALVACSNSLGQRATEILGDGVAPVVIHNGIDTQKFAQMAGERVSTDRRVVLSVGKFEEKKGHDVLLRAFASLAEDYDDLDLVLIGATAASLPRLRQMCIAEGIENRVSFFPDMPHPEVAQWFQRATLFALPSREEPFGIVLLEAGCLGLPVVASNVGGIPEILEEGVTGWMVSPDDVPQLAGAMRRILDDPASGRSMGDRLRSRVVKDFSWSAASEKYMSLASENSQDTPRAPVPETNLQSAYHQGHNLASEDVDRDLSEAMRVYLVSDLGIALPTATERAQSELRRRIPKAVISELADRGISVKGQRVLDLGAGLGAMSEELLLSGARVVSLEPGGAWALLTQRRLERHDGEFELLHSFGESIPLPDHSVDLIVSLQVLEHVNEPQKVLSEAFRVLRPGGHFFLICENYLAFWEPHYRVAWFPLLPKFVGSMYLRLRGRSPKFLNEAITYTTFPGVVRSVRRLGFKRQRDEDLAHSLASKSGLKWRVLRGLSAIAGIAPVRVLNDGRYYFKVGIYELLIKPAEQTKD